SGRLRAEVFLDPAVGTYFQGVSDDIVNRGVVLPHSFSARLFGIRLRGEHPYDVWSGAVPVWIAGELARGRVVLACDIQEYFPNIRSEHVGAALKAHGVHASTVTAAASLIDRINAALDSTGAARQGLPVCPLDFFWLVGDLVLVDVDRAIAAQAFVRHMRWLDDFFVSVPASAVDRASTAIEAILRAAGFTLNREKQRVFSTRQEFRTLSADDAHELLNQAASINDRSRVADMLVRARTLA